MNTDLDNTGCNAYDITSPLCFDFDGSVNNGEECLVGTQIDTNSYRIYQYTLIGGTTIDEEDFYPEALQGSGDGEILGNLIQTEAFPSSTSSRPELSVCAIGYDNTDNKLQYLCANENVGLLNTETLFYDESNDNYWYDMTANENRYYMMAHSVEVCGDITCDDELNEVLTPFGTFELDYSAIDAELNLLWEAPFVNNSNIPIYFDNTENFDIIALGENYLRYYNDESINFNCNNIVWGTNYNITGDAGCIWNIKYNPNPQNVLEVNTTFELSITVQDFEDNPVSVNVTWYLGEAGNERNTFVANITSGDTQPFSTTVNITGTYELRVIAWDSENPTERQSFTRSFTVANEGQEHGDTTYDETPGVTTNATTSVSVLIGQTGFEDDLLEIADDFGIGTWILWVLFMFILGAGILMTDKIPTSVKLPALVGGELGLILIGRMMGVISFGFTVGVFVLILIPIGLFILTKITGSYD
jgi:hypothetical protein